MTYRLQPGTIPHRVYNWLRMQPNGAEFSSAVLAEELGIDPANIVPCLKTPYNHGVINGRQDDRRLWYWSLGDGVPRAKPADDEPDEPLQTRSGNPEPGAAASPKAKTARKPKPSKVLPVNTPDAEHFRVGRFSDGTVVIEHNHDVISLSSAQADELAVFLQS